MIKQYALVASLMVFVNMQALQLVRVGMRLDKLQSVARMATTRSLQNRRFVFNQSDNKQEMQVSNDNLLQQRVTVAEPKVQLNQLLNSQLSKLLLEKKELLVCKHAAMGAGIIFTIPYFYALSIHDNVAGSIIAFTSTVTALPMWSKFYGAHSDLITLEKQIKVTQENIARVEKDQPLKLDN